SRELLAKNLKCKPKQIFFTGSATESNNWAIESAWHSKSKKGKRILAAIDSHPSVTAKMDAMTSRGAEVKYISVNKDGIIDSKKLSDLMTKDTIFISLLWVNNEIGVIQNINELLSLIKEKLPDCLIHVDAVQGYAKLKEVCFLKDIDFMSISGHKIGGPKGCGALIVKEPNKLIPLIYGGGQEFNKRGGTENVASMLAFAKASELMFQNLNENLIKVKFLQETFEKLIKHRIGDIVINGVNTARSPYISNFSVCGIRGEVLVHALEELDIYISTGSACSSKKEIYSPVLKAMGLEKKMLEGSFRVSFYPSLNENEIISSGNIVADTIVNLRTLHQRK
ncbi:MAG: hypothetical protein ACD_79C00466G0019, partial [uncultured bacterium]